MIDWSSIGVLAVDWDETVTAKDTMSLVAEAAYSEKPGFEPKWDYFFESYMNDYGEYSKQAEKNPKIGDRTTLVQEVEFLSGLDTVEAASVNRVESSNLFKDVSLESVLAQAHKAEIRPSWWRLLEHVSAIGISVAVVSVNWSGELIQQVLLNNGYSNIEVRANCLSKQDNLLTGKLSEGRDTLRTASDKVKVLKQLRTQLEPNKALCYIGDSSTDFLALIEADVGLVIGKRKTHNRLVELGCHRVEYIDDFEHLL